VIKKVTMKNFQSHKDSTIEFTNGVNTIIGTSDHGKSSIIRAIQLVRENVPSGLDYVSNWVEVNTHGPKETTEVVVETDTNTLRRCRGNKENDYHLDDTTFSAFGLGVPEEIEDALAMTDLNLQEQKDSFFLLNQSSGEIMRRINSFVNLELIDTTLSNANKAMHQVHTDMKITTATKEDALAQIESLADTKTLDLLYSVASKAMEHRDHLVEKKATTLEILSEIDRIVPEIENGLKIALVEGKLVEAERRMKGILEKKDKRDSVSSVLENIDKITKEMDTLISVDISKELEMLEQIKEKKSSMIDVKNLLEKIEEYTALTDTAEINIASNKLKRLTKSLEEIVDKKDTVEAVRVLLTDLRFSYEKHKQLSKELQEKEAKFKELMPDVCPLCGNDCGCKE